jgi:hypothetical protein
MNMRIRGEFEKVRALWVKRFENELKGEFEKEKTTPLYYNRLHYTTLPRTQKGRRTKTGEPERTPWFQSPQRALAAFALQKSQGDFGVRTENVADDNFW